MSDEYAEAKGDYGPQDGKPGSPADRSAKTAVPDSFPASDPVATTPAVGVRAMDVSEMMEEAPAPEPVDATPLVARFADGVTAKLMVEKLVREVPLDRRCTTISEERDGGALLEINAAGADLGRIRQMLEADRDAQSIGPGG
jgi:hypothetical protein